MIRLSHETIALARRLAAAQGISLEDAVRQAIEQSAREAGVAAHAKQRDHSPQAIATRAAQLDNVASELAKLPVLDPRSAREIMDDLNAL